MLKKLRGGREFEGASNLFDRKPITDNRSEGMTMEGRIQQSGVRSRLESKRRTEERTVWSAAAIDAALD
jgi:hypothetical protein